MRSMTRTPQPKMVSPVYSEPRKGAMVRSSLVQTRQCPASQLDVWGAAPQRPRLGQATVRRPSANTGLDLVQHSRHCRERSPARRFRRPICQAGQSLSSNFSARAPGRTSGAQSSRRLPPEEPVGIIPLYRRIDIQAAGPSPLRWWVARRHAHIGKPDRAHAAVPNLEACPGRCRGVRPHLEGELLPFRRGSETLVIEAGAPVGGVHERHGDRSSAEPV